MNDVHAASNDAISEALPVDVQLDLLMSELAALAAADDHAGVVALIPEIRALDVDLPEALYFVEARSLYQTGDALAARDRLLVYLSSAGRDGRYYDQATELLLEVKEAAEIEERERRVNAERRQRELAEAARKARVLHIREAQRKLHALGFWLGPETGELDMASREAIAIFQVRRSLTVSGDVDDELISQLRAEAPDKHECDTVTSNPSSWLEPETPLRQIDPDVALAACADALRRYPDVVRFQIQEAMAMMAADRNEDALLNLQNGADLNYPRALYWVGRMHEDGRLSEKGKPDYVAAAGWYRRAAARQYPEAERRLGMFYQGGDGVTRSDSTALDWYLKAAEQGYAPAQLAVGKMLEAGKGAKRDYAKALDWYTAASESKNAEATYLVGRMFERGRGVKRDKAKAKEWYTKAAGLGYTKSSSSR
jgi:TPR repeat protein